MKIVIHNINEQTENLRKLFLAMGYEVEFYYGVVNDVFLRKTHEKRQIIVTPERLSADINTRIKKGEIPHLGTLVLIDVINLERSDKTTYTYYTFCYFDRSISETQVKITAQFRPSESLPKIDVKFGSIKNLSNGEWIHQENDTNDLEYFGAIGIVDFEKLYIKFRQTQHLTHSDNYFSGLALSGGGIRSASFCLGVMQALAYNGWMKKVDYLSTVSGGGYIGASLSWLLHQDWEYPKEKNSNQPPGKLSYDLTKENFPFKTNPIAESVPIAANTKEQPNQTQNNTLKQVENIQHEKTLLKYKGRLLRYIRQNANYLTPNGFGDKLSLAAVFLRNILFSIAAYGLILVTALIVGDHIIDFIIDFANKNPNDLFPSYILSAIRKFVINATPFKDHNHAFLIGYSLSFIFVLLLPYYIIINRFYDTDIHTGYGFRSGFETLVGRLFFLICLFFIVGTLPEVYYHPPKLEIFSKETINRDMFAKMLAGIGVLSSLIASMKTNNNPNNLLYKIFVWFSVITLTYGLALLAYAIKVSMDSRDSESLFHINKFLFCAVVVFLVIVNNFETIKRRDCLLDYSKGFIYKKSGILVGIISIISFGIALLYKNTILNEWRLIVYVYILSYILLFILYSCGIFKKNYENIIKSWLENKNDCIKGFFNFFLELIPNWTPIFLHILLYFLIISIIIHVENIKPPLIEQGLIYILLVLLGLCNLNYLSIHRYYRDRLMEVFMPDVPVALGSEGPIRRVNNKADEFTLRSLITSENGKNPDYHKNNYPYHIINTNLVLTDSNVPKYRGRGGDNFILSPLFCGSNATGWCETGGQSPFSEMTLATAMAISGAAVNPNTGVGGHGITRNPLLSFLMGFFNIRLGFWVDSPIPDNKLNSLKLKFYRFCSRLFSAKSNPTILYPGLLEFLFGQNLNENSSMLQLSDGGHFENLGLYELIRRRLNLIIVCDAAEDANYGFADLGNAIEKVRADFGAIIHIHPDSLHDLIPAKDSSQSHEQAYAKRGYLTAGIDYTHSETENNHGVLIYLKATFIKSLPADLHSYRKVNPVFPNESTGNQFFDETQFEAYRELGYTLAYEMTADMPTPPLSPWKLD